MGFNALINKCNQVAVTKFTNVTATITLNGIVVKTIPGIFDEAAEVVSSYESERLITKPAVTVASVDLEGIASAHVLQIRDVEYKFDGKPRPDGHGLTIIYLGVKK